MWYVKNVSSWAEVAGASAVYNTDLSVTPGSMFDSEALKIQEYKSLIITQL